LEKKLNPGKKMRGEKASEIFSHPLNQGLGAAVKYLEERQKGAEGRADINE